MNPYFETKLGKLYHGDCLEIMPEIAADAIITDPVWPNSTADIPGSDRPYELFAEMIRAINDRAVRLCVHLGCDSNPIFLNPIGSSWNFFRVVWLEIVRPHYKGRLMYGSDVAYLFGVPPKSKPGQRVIPGRFTDTSSKGKEADHPCPRKIGHVRWLVNWWSEESDLVLDPFAGSCSTPIVCEYLNRRWIGIEISEEYCEIAAKRIEKETQQLKLWN